MVGFLEHNPRKQNTAELKVCAISAWEDASELA